MTDRVRLNYLQFVDGRVGEVSSIMRCFENVDTQPRRETRDIKLRSLRGATQVPD